MKNNLCLIGIFGLSFLAAECSFAQDQTTTTFNGSQVIGTNQFKYYTGIPAVNSTGPGVYSIFGAAIAVGSSNTGYTIPPLSTNQIALSGTDFIWGQPGTQTNLIVDVSMFDSLGFTFNFTGLAGATNGPIGVLVYPSYDGGVIFSQTPYYSFTNNESASAMAAAGGTYTFTVAANLVIPGATTLAFVLENDTTNYSVGWDTTNADGELNLKANTVNSILQGYGTGQ